MDDPGLAFFNTPVGAVMNMAIGVLFWVLILLPLLWWRQEDLVRQQLRDLEDQIWRGGLSPSGRRHSPRRP